jgi:Ankyrin repeats (many copies)
VLHAAWHNLDVLRFLFETGKVNVQATDSRGETVLHTG